MGKLPWTPGQPKNDAEVMPTVVREDFQEDDPYAKSGPHRLRALLIHASGVVDELRDDGFIYCWIENGERFSQRGDHPPRADATPAQVEAWERYKSNFPDGPAEESKREVRWTNEHGVRTWIKDRRNENGVRKDRRKQ